MIVVKGAEQKRCRWLVRDALIVDPAKMVRYALEASLNPKP